MRLWILISSVAFFGFTFLLMGQDKFHRDSHNWQREMSSIDLDQALINGRLAEPGEFPATVYSRQGNSRCTATLIGPRVLLHAAHCMSNGGSASFTVGGISYNSKCTHHPSYRGNSTADWALCLVDRPVTGVVFETVENEILRVGEKVTLSGYGCTRPRGGGGNDGKLRVGDSTVIRTPSGTNYDTVSRSGAALCFGDSGGPAYIYRNGTRKVFAVNSRGDIATTSYLSSTFTNTFQSWANGWLRSNQVLACGLSPDAINCYGGSEPEPEPEPIDCWQVYEDLGFCVNISGDQKCIEKASQFMECVK